MLENLPWNESGICSLPLVQLYKFNKGVVDLAIERLGEIYKNLFMCHIILYKNQDAEWNYSNEEVNKLLISLEGSFNVVYDSMENVIKKGDQLILGHQSYIVTPLDKKSILMEILFM